MVAQNQNRFQRLEEKIKETPPKSWGKLGAGVAFGGFAFGWIAFPYILDFAMDMMVNLNEGNIVRTYWVNIPQKLVFSAYLFNITNPDEVQNGGKPNLQEVGPYVYYNYKSKANLVDNNEEDTVTFSHVNTWYYQKELTYPLTGNEIITLPHLPLMSMLLVGQKDFPTPMLSVLNAAMPGIYGKLKSPFMSAKASDYLFDGIVINCTSKSVLPRTVCVAVKQNSKGLEIIGENLYKFSIFGPRNGTPEDARLTVFKGSRVKTQIGQMVAVDGLPYIPTWREGDCKTVRGGESTLFPPYRKPDNNSILAYSTEICRVLRGTYVGEGEYKGIPGYMYTLGFGDVANNPSDKCYCTSPPQCYKKGTSDLLKCQGVPVVATKPHFLDCDESYLAGVTGLNPSREKHEIFALIHPLSGTPLHARKRVQLNMEIRPLPFVNLTRKLRRTMLPLIWVEESLDLEGELMAFLEGNLLNNLRLVDILKWSLIGVGGLLAIVGAARAVSLRKGGNQGPQKKETPVIVKRNDGGTRDAAISPSPPSVFSVSLPPSVPGTPESLGSGRSYSPHGTQTKSQLPPINTLVK